MNIFVDNSNNIFTTNDISYLPCFTEYTMRNANIKISKISNNYEREDKNYSNILLIPMTHINNIWHLMHHIFISYKYINKNKLNTENVSIYPIFFDGFYKRQGDILKCIYNDLIFTGLGFNFDMFKELHTTFRNKKMVHVNSLKYVNENLNFRDEPLFDDFKKYILGNFNITYEINDKKIITFILRKGTRQITNIDYVKDALSSYHINYVYLEDYTVKEQLEIIANTDMLIGVHGAGLSWCIFMKNNSTLLEMYPGNSNTDNYIRWCTISKINYKRLPINITSGTVHDFRNARVNINDNHIKSIKSFI